MKRRKLLSFILSFCMALGLMMVPAMAVLASETGTDNVNPDVIDARKGVVQIVLYAVIKGDEDNPIALGSGTGILIGTEEGAQHVVTNYHVAVEFDGMKADDFAELLKENGYPEDTKAEYEIRISVRRDVSIKADVVNSSKEGDFCILKMEQPIYDREPLVLADVTDVTATEPVYALGFPGAVEGDDLGKITEALYTPEDVTVTSGIVSKLAQSSYTGATISTIVHSAAISAGNSGGPLVNDKGYVVGLNTYGYEANYFYSTDIKEVTQVLKALGIDAMYESELDGTSGGDAGESGASGGAGQEPGGSETSGQELGDGSGSSNSGETSTTPPAEESVAERNPLLDELDSAVNEARSVSLDGMSEESVAAFNSALRAAEQLAGNDAASDAEINSAIAALQEATNNLEPAASNTMLIIIIAAVAVIVIIIVVIIIIVTSRSKKKKAAEAQKKAQEEAARKADEERRRREEQMRGQWGSAQQRPPQPQAQ